MLKGLLLTIALSASVTSLAGNSITVETPSAIDFLKPVPSALTPRHSSPVLLADDGDKLTMDFGYCYEPQSAIGFNQGEKQKFAIYIPEETCQRYAGATVDAAVLANGCIPNDEYADFKISFYYSLDDEPFYSFDDKMEVRNHYVWRAHELPEPFVIEADKPFYLVTEWPVKYYGPRDEEDPENNYYPCAVDWAMTPDKKGYSDLSYCIDINTLQYIWVNLGDLLGNNCMRLRLSGESLPVNDMGTSELLVPARIIPDEEFVGTIILTNWGANDVTDCVYSIQLGDGKPIEYKVDFCEAEDGEPLKYHDSYKVAFAASTDEIGPNVPVKANIVSVNSKADKYTSNNESFTTTLSITNQDGYSRNLFVEESTGTWCGWCPTGIEGFEQMRKIVPYQFVGMAVHNGSGEPMTPWDGSFDEIISSFKGQAPLMYVNYHREMGVSPSPANLSVAYNAYCAYPAYIDINIDNVSTTADAVEFDVNYEFAGPADNVYTLLYAITEDNVGPFPQKNYFNSGYGMTTDTFYGWEEKEKTVMVNYNDVAVTRRIIENATCFPEKIEGKQTYNDKVTLTIDNKNRPASRKAVKPEDVNVIVAVVNKLNGFVENCAIQRSESFTSINNVNATVEPAATETEYFDMNGRRVNPDNLVPGIYLRRSGSSTSKVLIK